MTHNHKTIWEKAYKPTQNKKSLANSLSNNQEEKAFATLINRGIFLKEMFKYFQFKNFAEVGTAEGYQFYVMADYLQANNIDGFSYSCDIRDARSDEFSNTYKKAIFTRGNSKHMAEKILDDKKKIDLFWIDGNHDKGAVLYDVIRLSKTQNKNCIWVFDDYNTRFGAFNEIKFLSRFNKSFYMDMGITASGRPNSLLVLEGSL